MGRLGLLGHLLVPPPHQLRVCPRGRLRLGVISQGRQALQTGDQAVAGEGGAEADDEQLGHGEQEGGAPLGDAEALGGPAFHGHLLEGVRGAAQKEFL